MARGLGTKRELAINQLYIRNLKIDCIIGCNPEERLKTQTLNLNIELSLGYLLARQTDELFHTVDYSKLAALLTQAAQKSQYHTIEILGQKLLETCLSFDSQIRAVDLDLEKLGCISNADSAGIILKASRT